jgi:hypothetical protein
LTLSVLAVGVFVSGLAVFAHQPRGARVLHALGRRWHEMHTPGSGRESVLPPDVLDTVTAMQKAGVRTFRFTPELGNSIGIAPFLVEAIWPIECRLEDENVLGYVHEFPGRPDCRVVGVHGELALAHCRL